ncbi:MAG: hypothetical protein AAGJ34_12535 [Pseudomonadota bacterium]
MTDPFKNRPRFLADLPRLIRVYICAVLVGFVISIIFTTMLIALNFANIGHLVFAVKGGYLAAFLLFFFNGIVFSGVQTGIIIMSLEDTDN